MGQNGKELSEKVLGNISKVIIGKEQTAKLLLTCLLADGHVLLEDVPGTGKTNACQDTCKISVCGLFQDPVHTGSSA